MNKIVGLVCVVSLVCVGVFYVVSRYINQSQQTGIQQADSTIEESTEELAGEMRLRYEVALGERIEIAGIAIAPIEILKDSRCPVDEGIVCRYEGQMLVLVQVTNAATSTEYIFSEGGRHDIFGVQVKLSKVLPEARIELATPESYRFIFVLSGGNGMTAAVDSTLTDQSGDSDPDARAQKTTAGGMGFEYNSDQEEARVGDDSMDTIASPLPWYQQRLRDLGARPIDMNSHTYGNAVAPTTVIVTYGDLQSPFNLRFFQTMFPIMQNDDSLLWVYRHFPLEVIHDKTLGASVAAECVARYRSVESFWLFVQAIMVTDQLDAQILHNAMRALGISEAQIERCWSDEEIQKAIKVDYDEAIALGARGAPHSVVFSAERSGTILGAQSRDTIEQLLSSF